MDILWGVLCIVGIIYFIVDYLMDFYKYIKRKIIIKDARESIVNMVVVNKGYIEGMVIYNDTSKYVQQKLPDSYMLTLKYKDREYTINDKDLFNKLKISDNINLKLIEKLDKYQNLISYKIEKLSKES